MRLSWGLPLLLLSCAVTPPQGISCDVDGDCAGGRCVEGSCVGVGDPEDPAPDAGPSPDPPPSPDAGPEDPVPDAGPEPDPDRCLIPADSHFNDGAFDLGLERWLTNAANAEVLVDPAHCGRFIRIAPTAADSGVGQIFQVRDDLVAGQSYRVRYDLRGAARDCRVRIIDHASPFGSWGHDETCDLVDGEWVRFESTFVAATPGGYSGAGARLHLLLNRANTSPVDIDNVVVEPL